MKEIRFFKMEGAGNDFVVIDNRDANFSLDEIIAFTPKLCDRKFGVGSDGLLALQHPQIEGVDYTMTYRNADGSDAGMCGNGSRCLALFAATHGFDAFQTFNVHNSIYKAKVDLNSNSVIVDFPDVSIPQNIRIENQSLIQIYTGTEHVVSFINSKELKNESALVKLGSMIRNHDGLNPPGSNVNFVCKTKQSVLELQTYERGVENLTLACGTGAIASAIAEHFSSNQKLQAASYTVKVKGGELIVSFSYYEQQEKYIDVKLAGPANFVFEGTINV
jgi:diaminopimelate epimerase